MNDEYDVADQVTLESDIENESSEPVVESVSEDGSANNGSNITVVINNPKSEEPVSDIENEDTIQEVIVREDDMILTDVSTEVFRVSASDATGLKAVVLGVIGDYETVVTDYEYRSGSTSYVSHSIDIQPDYAWLCSCAIFLVCLYSMFRLYGLVFGRGRR